MGALRSAGLLSTGILLLACGSGGSVEPGATGAAAVPGPPGATGTTTASAPPTRPAAPIALPPSGVHFGATPYDADAQGHPAGVEVRVWAPNAKAVKVAGELANDPAGARALVAEPGKGTFALRIDGGKAGQRYHFVLTADDGSERSRPDPRGRWSEGGESVVVDPRSYAWKSTPFTPPPRAKAIVYELFVGAFNVTGGATSGTFASAAAKLDALADLGVNVVELMPVNGHGPGGWGYGPQQWFATHGEFGSPDELRHLVDEAHARGIAVVLDLVFNHYDSWSGAPLRCFDRPCPDGSAGVYFFDAGPYAFTPWGPRPDFAKPAVADFFVDNVFAWIHEYRIDGFRHDSVSNIRGIDGQGTVPGGVSLLQRMNEVTEAECPGALVIAEDLKGNASVTGPRSAGGLGFATQWDGGFHWAVTGAVVAATDAARDLGAVRDALLNRYNGDPFQRLLYVESHDTAGNDGARLPVRIDAADPTSHAARKRAMLAAGVLLTAPGVPMLFMGQEWLEDVKFDPKPAPLDGSKATAQAGVRTFYRDLARLRRDLDGNAAGLTGSNVAVTHLNTSGDTRVIAYRRWGAVGDDVMVVANFGGTRFTRYDVGVPGPGTWRARVDSDDRRYGADFGASAPTAVAVTSTPRDGLAATASIVLAPYSLVVLTR